MARLTQDMLGCTLVIALLVGCGGRATQPAAQSDGGFAPAGDEQPVGLQPDLSEGIVDPVLLDSGPAPSPVCPQEPPTHGQPCSLPPDLWCEGQAMGNCSGYSAGSEDCFCVDGAWDCYNVMCASYCPPTILEAVAGPPCTPESGACYYTEHPVSQLCSCSQQGIVTCGCGTGVPFECGGSPAYCDNNTFLCALCPAGSFNCDGVDGCESSVSCP